MDCAIVSVCVPVYACMAVGPFPGNQVFFVGKYAGYQGDLRGWHKLMMKGVVGQQNSYTEVHSTMHLVHPSDTQWSCHYSLKYVYTICTYYIYVHTYQGFIQGGGKGGISPPKQHVSPPQGMRLT